METQNITDKEALEKALENWEPVDIADATKILKEIKQILDNAGVTFFLRQGTCLGAIREHEFIPWDDDVDVGSVLGLHGLTEEIVESMVHIFRSNGFLTRVEHLDHCVAVPLVKSSVRADWRCYRIIGDSIFQYPAVRTPVSLFTDLKEITFVDENFYVPNPPEEYLRIKYGDDWMVPKPPGNYEADILNHMPEGIAPGRAGRLRQFFARYISGHNVSRLKVLDQEGNSVAGAEITIAGLGHFKTNKKGYARLYIPEPDDYALVVRFRNHEEVRYVEYISPGETYIYRPNDKLHTVSDTDTSDAG